MLPRTDELNQLKGQFLISLNHEIRTPLSGILGMADLLLETHLSDEQKEYVEATHRCAEALLETFNATIEFSALVANHVELEEAEFPLRETLQGLVTEFAAKASGKGLQMTVKLDQSLPESAIGDALRLRQMLWHLLGNAVKFTNQGEIELRAQAGLRSSNGVPLTIQVRDTGIGIPAHRLQSIFDSFLQLETGLARNYPGLGLGLAIAQKLAILLHAEIAVESETGRGSTFTVRVTLGLPAQVALRAPDPKAVRGRVLVVDDNVVAQTIASHILRRHSYQVKCARSGPEAVSAASESTFDLILMDLQMPGMDGFETVTAIRRLAGYADTPVLAVTANCSNEYRDLCLNSGMQGFLPKPVHPADLVEAAERFLALAPAGEPATMVFVPVR